MVALNNFSPFFARLLFPGVLRVGLIQDKRVQLQGGREGGNEVADDLLQLVVVLLRDHALFADLLQQGLLVGENMLHELLLEFGHVDRIDLVKIASDTGVDDGDLLLNSHGHWKGTKPSNNNYD